MATPSWAQKPLPPGWEAKYDQRSGKYFFVHHMTKTTQWVDPRAGYYGADMGIRTPAPAMARQPSPAAQRYGAQQIRMQERMKCKTCKTAPVSTQGAECAHCQAKSIQREQIAAREKYARDEAQKKREQEERIKQEQEKRRAQSAQRRNVQETNFGGEEDEEEEEAAPVLTPAQKAALLRELSATYSDVSSSVIDMVLESCQFKRTMAIGVLNSMSSKKGSTEAPKPKKITVETNQGEARSHAHARTMYGRIQLINDLQETYKDVQRSVIDMVLDQCHNNKEAAASVLSSMSSQKAPSQSASPQAGNMARHNMPAGQLLHKQHHSPSAQAAAQRGTSPSPAAAQRSVSPSPRPSMKFSEWQYPGNAVNKNAVAFDIKWANQGGASAAATTPLKKVEPKKAEPVVLTAYQKNKMKQALKKKYPNASDNVITLALDTTKYDQSKADAVLSFMNTEGDKKSTPKKSTETSSDDISESMSVKDLKDLAKKKGVDISTCIEKGDIIATLRKASGMSASASAATTSKASTSTSKTSTSSAPAKASVPKVSITSALKGKTTQPAAPKKQTPPSKPQQTPPPRPRESRAKGGDKRSAQDTKQRAEFIASHSSMAKGADSSLAKGSNKDLLIDNYVKEGGADPTLRHGPNKAYNTGPSVGSTKNSSLASGPQSSLRNGPQSSLSKGSLYQHGDRQN